MVNNITDYIVEIESDSSDTETAMHINASNVNKKSFSEVLKQPTMQNYEGVTRASTPITLTKNMEYNNICIDEADEEDEDEDFFMSPMNKLKEKQNNKYVQYRSPICTRNKTKNNI